MGKAEALPLSRRTVPAPSPNVGEGNGVTGSGSPVGSRRTIPTPLSYTPPLPLRHYSPEQMRMEVKGGVITFFDRPFGSGSSWEALEKVSRRGV